MFQWYWHAVNRTLKSLDLQLCIIQNIKVIILIVFKQKCLYVSVNVMNNDTVRTNKFSFCNILFHKVGRCKIQQVESNIYILTFKSTHRILLEQGLVIGILPLDMKSMAMVYFQNYLYI